jgi:hypothetical protein
LTGLTANCAYLSCVMVTKNLAFSWGSSKQENAFWAEQIESGNYCYLSWVMVTKNLALSWGSSKQENAFWAGTKK